MRDIQFEYITCYIYTTEYFYCCFFLLDSRDFIADLVTSYKYEKTRI